MSDQFLAEIRFFSFNFAPRGWATCSGQILPLSQNTALFSLLGTTYGGNGVTTFGLPDLQGRAAMHPGQGAGSSYHYLGDSSGTESVTLAASQLPAHLHGTLQGENVTATATGTSPSGNLFAGPYANARYTGLYATTGTKVDMGSMIGNMGSGLPHNNMQPFQTLNPCIALTGIFPPRS